MKIKKQIKKIDSIFSKKIRSKKTYKLHIKLLKKDIKTIKKTYEKGKIRDEHIYAAICTAVENILIFVITSNKLPFNSAKFIESFKHFRCNLIATFLETPEGREKIAKAMVEPIRRALDYQGIGRKLFMVDELPEGAKATYETGKIEMDDMPKSKEKKCKKKS